MNEIVNNVERILANYNISFKNLNQHRARMLMLESSSPDRLRKFMQEQFHKDINMDEAKDLEILLLTYQYIDQN